MAGDFSSAWQLLRWAREDIQTLEAASQAFLADQPYSFTFEDDRETGHVLLKLRMATVPDEVCKLASHALWDIKHALDHAACAAVRAVRGDQITDIHFPIASHPASLEATLKATVKKGTELKFPPALHDTLRSFEPYPTGGGYPGGGDEFCALSKLANTTKHSVALAAIPLPNIAAFQGTGSAGADFHAMGRQCQP